MGSSADESNRTKMAKLTYGSYLKIDELLRLQTPRSDPEQHDELLFIVVHQVYELWFLQLLHEVEATMRALDGDELLQARKAFARIHAIQRLLEEHVDILETMTPREFNTFRNALEPASGFQSAQFRELEIVCGAGWAGDLTDGPTHVERERLERRLAEPTLYDKLKALLARRGFATATPDELVASFKTIYDSAQDRYALCLLLEDFVEFDERLLLWRHRHLRMAERMIGMKPGTGGSLGVDYLGKTLSKKLFPELWAVRTHLRQEPDAATAATLL